MLLRSISKHVNNQNWFAVALDFMIVVVGVFIGIQVSNWNAAQSTHHDYKMALERYVAEIDANLSDLRDAEENSLERLAIVRKGFDTLMTCEESPENRSIVEAGVNRIMGAYGVEIRTTSLWELTDSSSLLAQQSAAERKIFNDTRFRIDFLLSEGDYFENLPLATRVELNPILALGEREIEDFGKFSTDDSLTPHLHTLVLAAPMGLACKDDTLLKAFYTWEYWQIGIPDLARALQETLEESREKLKL